MPDPDIRMREVAGRDGGFTVDSSTIKRTWDIYDRNKVATFGDIRAYAFANIPNQLDLRSPAEIAASAPQQIVGLSNLDWDEDRDRYLFTGTYTSRNAESTLRMSWDSTGGTVRMTASRGTSAYPRSGTVAPNFYSAIGVQDGKPEGVDVAIPALKLVFSYRWPRGAVNLAYIKACAARVGTTNSAPWYTFAAGELLFLGTTGEIDYTSPTEVQYHFVASANVTGLTIGGIADITKAGHQYLWVCFDPTVDGSASCVVQRPRACYVETVYGESNFADFGIGS